MSGAVIAPSGRHQAGLDHPHHGWSPMPGRRPVRFSHGAAVAICPVISFETHEDEIPANWPQPNWLAGGVGIRPDPNIGRIGQRDYGLRRGWDRLREIFLAHDMRFAIACDVMTAEALPALRDGLAEDVAAGRGEWVAHGLSVNRPIHNLMSETEEAAYIAETGAGLAACGINANGWFGIEYGESVRTPALLAAAGYRYTLDWCNDEQPYSMTVPQGDLIALPQFADLDDAFCFAAPRGITPRSYADRLVLAAFGLAVDGRHSARVLLWHMRPFLSGQPFRIAQIAEAFAKIADIPGVVFATPSGILDALEDIP